jgi:hypothetical protein
VSASYAIFLALGYGLLGLLLTRPKPEVPDTAASPS